MRVHVVVVDTVAAFTWVVAVAAARILVVLISAVAVLSMEAARTSVVRISVEVAISVARDSVVYVNSMEAVAISAHRAHSQGRRGCALIQAGMWVVPSTADPATLRGRRPDAMALQLIQIAQRG